jgi:hypothetical protein
MMVQLPEIGPIVRCTYAEQHGEDPIAHTNLLEGLAFCANCGATDHKEM